MITKIVWNLGIGAAPRGLRSSFRALGVARVVGELALARANRDCVDVAYRCPGVFDRRRGRTSTDNRSRFRAVGPQSVYG